MPKRSVLPPIPPVPLKKPAAVIKPIEPIPPLRPDTKAVQRVAKRGSKKSPSPI
jgi:hypothetical protein